MAEPAQSSYAGDEPFFKALLTPHRSLGRTGFLVLMGTMLAAWAITAAIFMAHGAWPIVGFFGLDVLGLWLAFRMSYRSGRMREEVSVSREHCDIRKIAPSGKTVLFRLNPFWCRFTIRRHSEIGIIGMAVETREQRVPIGAFLNPDDRESFAKAFGQALATAKAR